MASYAFHPVVARWFQERFGPPTEPQERGWPASQALLEATGQDVDVLAAVRWMSAALREVRLIVCTPRHNAGRARSRESRVLRRYNAPNRLIAQTSARKVSFSISRGYWRLVADLAGPAGAKSRVCALLVMARAAG